MKVGAGPHADTNLVNDLNNFPFPLYHLNRKLDRVLDLGLPPLVSRAGWRDWDCGDDHDDVGLGGWPLRPAPHAGQPSPYVFGDSLTPLVLGFRAGKEVVQGLNVSERRGALRVPSTLR